VEEITPRRGFTATEGMRSICEGPVDSTDSSGNDQRGAGRFHMLPYFALIWGLTVRVVGK
jgi:hypothetical protein